MNNEIKITVIVPAYNVAEWLPRCIESILCQTHDNLEILVINDGSTDDTGYVLDRYAMSDDRIIPIHQENRGVTATRERGIKMARGQYIGFVDGDDEIEQDMYERLLNNALQHDAQISQCGILYCFYDGRKKPMHGTGKKTVYDRIEGYRELMQGIRMEPSLCNKLYERKLFLESSLDETISINEDFLKNAILFSQVEKSVFEDFCGYHYWRREGSASNNNKVVEIGENILKARKLVVDMASQELWKYAFASYLSVLISTYNSLIGYGEREAIALRKRCKFTLSIEKERFAVLNTRLKCRAYAILYCTDLYEFIYKICKKRFRVKLIKN